MMRWPFVGRRERLRREASDWIARLNGSHDQSDRAAFEQWYRADPGHAATYDRLSALFAAAGHMHPAPGPEAVRVSSGRGTHGLRPRYALAGIAVAGVVVILGYAMLGAREAVPSAQPGVQVAVFVAAGSETRRITLSDGSEVLLSPGSELDVDIGVEQRWLQLKRGEVRFTVAHEDRPFVVAARGTEVVARGTQFIVSMTSDGTLVSLIEGRVEVSYASPRAGGERRVTSMEPGQRLVVPADLASDPVATGAQRPPMIEFDDTRLAEAVERVNHEAERQVHLADAKLAELRVTGAFRAGDVEGFAKGVAAALDLEVWRRGDGTLVLDTRDKRGS